MMLPDPRILREAPPNFAEIEVALSPRPLARGSLVYAYAPYIYNPDGVNIQRFVIEHEKIHIHRQAAEGPVIWWKRYISDPVFRYREELLSHAREYVWRFKTDVRRCRISKDRLMVETIDRLLAPAYRYPEEFTRERALADIQRLRGK
jgi:hypothetical protein